MSDWESSVAILRSFGESERDYLEEMLHSGPRPRVEGYSMLPRHSSQRRQHVGQRGLDLVGITKYRKAIVGGAVGQRLRELVVEVCKTNDVEI
jgi:hypothetical protein